MSVLHSQSSVSVGECVGLSLRVWHFLFFFPFFVFFFFLLFFGPLPQHMKVPGLGV